MKSNTAQIAEEAWKQITDYADNCEDAIGDLAGDANCIRFIKSAIDSALTQPKQIPLTNGQFATVDHQDFVSLAGITWHCTNHGRAATGKTNYMHKVIAAQMGITGEVDHIDGNPLNNRRSNLRGCTRTQNQANAPKSRGSTSKYKGVHWSESHNGWVAQIKHNEKVTYLGQFENEIDAALTYDAAAISEFKDFAKLNFPILRNLIEKAIKEHDKEQHYYAALGEAESRPTHARDGGVCPECGTSWPRHKGLCGGGSAAHASEHDEGCSKDRPHLFCKPCEQDDTKRQIKAAEKLCEIYFNIAAQFISEDEIRKRRDIAIDAAMRKDEQV